MNRIWRAIAVDARMDDVFGFLADPHNLADAWPNLDAVRHIEPSKVNGAYDFEADFRIAQQKLRLRAESVDARRYDRLKIKTANGLDSTINWKLAPLGGRSTRVTLQFDYETPKQAAEHETPRELIRQNERGVDEMLKNIKSRVEAERSYAKA